MVNRRFYHKILIIILIFAIFTTSCFASTTSNMIDGIKNLSTVDEIYNYIKTTFGSDGSNVTNSFLNGILQTLKKRLSTVHDIVWIDFGTRNSMGAAGDLGDYMYRDSNTQASIYSKLNEFYNRYYTYSDGNAALLNQINTNTTNMYGSQSASNVHLASINKDVSKLSSDSVLIYDNKNYFRGIWGSHLSASQSDGIITLKNFDGTLPAVAGFNVPTFNGWYIVSMDVYTPKTINISPLLSGATLQNVNVPINAWTTIAGYGHTTTASTTGGIYITSGSLTSSDTVQIKNLRYIYVPEFEMYQNIVNAINNKQLEANVDVSINNTITDNDLTLDVDLPDNATNDTSNLLNKLKQLMLTGVATNQLLNALDDVELHTWYSQSNKDVVEALNNQYTSLYD